MKTESITKRRSVDHIARRVAMYCCSKYCCFTSTLTDIADYFSVSISGLTRARDRFEVELRNSNELKKSQ